MNKSDNTTDRGEKDPLEITAVTIEVQTRDKTPEEAKQALHEMKTALLDKYGLFGGGPFVNGLHNIINKKLEGLGRNPNT